MKLFPIDRKKAGNFLYRVAVIVLLAIIAFSCSPQKRLNRKVKRAENFAYKHGLIIQDTIVVIDTLVIESYTHDTTRTFIRQDSVTVINNEKVYLKYFYDTLRQEIYHEVICKGDTIIREIVVPVDKIKVVEKSQNYLWWIVGFLILLIIVLIYKRKYPTFTQK